MSIRQVTERGYPVREVAERLGVSTYSLCMRLEAASKTPRLVAKEGLRAENARLTTMSRVLRMHRSGFHAWLKKPQSRGRRKASGSCGRSGRSTRTASARTSAPGSTVNFGKTGSVAASGKSPA